MARDDEKMITIIRDHQRRKPHFSVQDAYKLMYQSVFGNTHLMKNLEHAKNYLHEEFNSVAASTIEPLIENISPDSSIVRLNLRAFKANNNAAIEALFQVMVISAQKARGSKKEFLRRWKTVKQAVSIGELNFDAAEMDAFDATLKAEGYPPVRHSEAYRLANRPAYRVVSQQVFNDVFRKQIIA